MRILKCDCGYCNTCRRRDRGRRYRSTTKAKTVERAYSIRASRQLDPDGPTFVLISILKEMIFEIRVNRQFIEKHIREFEVEERLKREREVSDFNKSVLLESRKCIDCFKAFVPLGGTFVGKGVVRRCPDCQHRFRLANHGGGPRRRCRQFGVPYEPINPLTVFDRDGWVCHLCGGTIDKSFLGQPQNPMAPEIEHKWPLSIMVEGRKNPGHVFGNVFASHRFCNQKKGNSFDHQNPIHQR